MLFRSTAISATSALGYIDDTFDAEANPGYASSDSYSGQQSPLWLDFGYTAAGGVEPQHNEYCANLYAITKLTANNDPRLSQIYAQSANANEISGLPFGDLGQEPDGSSPSIYGPGILTSPTQNAWILSSAESLLLQAEAVNEGLIPGTAQTLYNSAVTASFVKLGVPDAVNAANTYLAAAGAYPLGGSDAAKEQAIIEQKWVALFGYGPLEMYSEFRRTGYPNDIPTSITPGATNPPGKNVSRIFYPVVVYNTNANNVKLEGTIDKFSSKIFWAK